MTAEVVLRLDGVEIEARTASGPRMLVRDFSLCVARGEVVGLIGESGSGKTTIARSIIGLLDKNVRVTAGTILFDGQVVHAPDVDGTAKIQGRHVGMVFQSAVGSLDPTMKVSSQLREVLHVHNKSLARKEMAKVIEATLRSMGLQNVPRVLNAYPHELSGGMAQRVAIALAVISRPALLIADECTSALDVTTQAEVMELLLELSRDGLGLLFVTHDLLLAEEICDRIAVMRDGRLVEVGTTRQVLNAPSDQYTKELIAAVADPFG